MAVQAVREKGVRLRPEICPACKGNKILEFTWACPLCLEGSKRETLRLLDFLKSDFGITDAQIQVCFSGNAGYHIEVAKSPLELWISTVDRKSPIILQRRVQ